MGTYGSVRRSTNGREDPSLDVDVEVLPRETDFLLPHDNSRHIPIVEGNRPCISSRMIIIKSLVVVLSFTAAWLVNVSGAWTMRLPPPGKAAAAVATLSIALWTGAAVVPAAAGAATGVDLFSGDYADPFHPYCQRHIEVVSPTRASVTGTDGTPGCPPDGSGRPWALTGILNEEEGTSILIDFTPKGGPKDLKGVWEASPVEGIRFPDGNLWSKKPTIQ
jgi:hypothetical protein